MKRFLIFAFLLLTVPGFGAWTEKYVKPAGGDAATCADAGANACSIAGAIAYCVANSCADVRMNIIAGTYAQTTNTRTFGGYAAAAPSTTAPLWWRGYKVTIGDLDDGVTLTRAAGTDLPSITFTTGQMVLSGVHQIFSNIAISSACTTAGGAVSITGGNVRLQKCRVTNTASDVAARAVSTSTTATAQLIGCRFQTTNTATNNVNVAVATGIYGCHIIGGAIAVTTNAAMLISNTIVESFATTGIATAQTSTLSHIDHCSIYASGGTNGINASTIPTTGNTLVTNCLIGGGASALTNGINAASATNTVVVFNTQFYNCTNNLVNIAEIATYNADLGVAQLLSIDANNPWAAVGSSNFTLLGSAAASKAAYPGVFEGQTVMKGYPDIGAVRHQDGGASFISMLLVGLGVLALSVRMTRW